MLNTNSIVQYSKSGQQVHFFEDNHLTSSASYNVTQCQFLSGVKRIWIQSFPSIKHLKFAVSKLGK